MKNIKLKISLLVVLLTAICLPMSGLAGTTTYTYDSYDRLGSVQYESGTTIVYSYDGIGNVSGQSIESGNILNLLIENDRGDFVNSVTMEPSLPECGTGHYCFGNVSSVTLTAVIPEGYNFLSWSEPSSSCDALPTCTVSLSGLTSVTANFAIKTFDVSTDAVTSGSIKPSSTQTVDYGTVLSFAITPDLVGYEASSFAGCGIHHVVGNSYQTAPIVAPCTISAGITIKTFTVDTNVVGFGTIS